MEKINMNNHKEVKSLGVRSTLNGTERIDTKDTVTRSNYNSNQIINVEKIPTRNVATRNYLLKEENNYIYLVEYNSRIFKLIDKNDYGKDNLVLCEKVQTFSKDYLLTILNKLDIISLKLILKNRGIEIRDVYNDQEVVDALYKAVEDRIITFYDILDYSDYKYVSIDKYL